MEPPAALPRVATSMLPTALWEHDLLQLQWGAVAGASLAAAAFDLRSRRIPNRLTGSTLVCGMLWAGFVAGWAGLADGALGCLLLAFPYVLLFAFAGGGAGDAKILGALGMWLGVRSGAILLASVALSGVLLAIVWAAASGRLAPALDNMASISRGVLGAAGSRESPSEARLGLPDPSSMQKVPYGLAIAAGTVLAALGVLLWKSA